MENSIALGADTQYVQQTKEYGKIDVLLVFILYIFCDTWMSFVGKVICLE